MRIIWDLKCKIVDYLKKDNFLEIHKYKSALLNNKITATIGNGNRSLKIMIYKKLEIIQAHIKFI